MFLSEHLGNEGREDGLFTFPKSFPEESISKFSLRERVGLSQEKDRKLFQNVKIVYDYAKTRDMKGHGLF